jgi:hypothetical protein
MIRDFGLDRITPTDYHVEIIDRSHEGTQLLTEVSFPESPDHGEESHAQTIDPFEIQTQILCIERDLIC